jgi:hypothetical protein
VLGIGELINGRESILGRIGKRFAVLAVVSLVVSLTSLAASPFTALAATSCVNTGGTDGCYSSIQAAVDAASDGGSITVAAVTYNESVMIRKPLQLIASGEVIVDATGMNYGLAIDGVDTSNPSVFVQGFTFENANLSGIVVRNSSHVLLSQNTVQNNDLGAVIPTDPTQEVSCPAAPFPFFSDDCGEGINLNGASFSVLYRNVVQNNRGGILMSDEVGATHDNMILLNQVINNVSDCGITLASHPAGFDENGVPLPGNGVYKNFVSYNTSNGNGGAGIGIFTPTPGTAAYDNTVIGNTASGNGLPGITLHSHAPGQNLNGNRFLFNTLSGNGVFGPDSDSGAPPSGIEISADASAGAAPITDTLVYGNKITNQDVGIWVGSTEISSSVHVNHNQLGGNTVGVQNAGTGTLDATQNYWGCSTGPVSADCAGVVGTVNYTPWMP